MSRGIYLVANNKVYDNAAACLNSIRYFDTQIPITVIPYDDDFNKVEHLCRLLHAKVFDDRRLLRYLDKTVEKNLPFIRHPKRLRNLACFLGEFDEFLYMDTDIVVFQDLRDVFEQLANYELVHADNQYHTGIKHVFYDLVPLPESSLAQVFNGGFWATRKDMLNLIQIERFLVSCSDHPDYFCTKHGGSAQPILNYLALGYDWTIGNLNKIRKTRHGRWAGTAGFEHRMDSVYDGGNPLMYLHWAGVPIKGHYDAVWKFFRDMP